MCLSVNDVRALVNMVRLSVNMFRLLANMIRWLVHLVRSFVNVVRSSVDIVRSSVDAIHSSVSLCGPPSPTPLLLLLLPPPLLLTPQFQKRLASTDVWQRESAMLSLGAVSEGCLEGLGPHLPALFGFLVQQQAAEMPQLRSISCWVLGRFMRWV